MAKGEHSYTLNPPYAFMAHTMTTSIYLKKDRTAKAVESAVVKIYKKSKNTDTNMKKCVS
jgi:hypothetical protein